MPASDKLEHLKLIQAVVTRLANNCFQLKGWTVALLAGLMALWAKEEDKRFVFIAWLPLVAFALLDSYYLWQERLYRSLYESTVARPEPKDSDGQAGWDYGLSTSEAKKTVSWWPVLYSKSILLFYTSLAVVLLVMTAYIPASTGEKPNAPVKGGEKK